MHTPHIYTTGHTDHRHTEHPHQRLHPALLSGRSARGFSATPLLVHTITQSWLGLPGPPVPEPTEVLPIGTHRHTHVSPPGDPLTWQSLQQLARSPWCLQQLASPVVLLLEIHAHLPAPTLFTHSPADPAWSLLAATCSLTHPHLLQYCSTDK